MFAHYPDGHGTRVSLVPTSRSAVTVGVNSAGEHTVSNQNLEQALEDIERAADGAVRATAAALTEAKRVKAAAASGQLRALRQSLDSVVRLADVAASAARDLQERWTFDEQQHFASGAYTEEVLAVAGEQGLSAFESDDRILSYPAIVSLSVSDTAVLIDKRKDRRVRPSVLVRTLKALQAKPPKFKPEAYLEALAAAYDLVVAAPAGQPGRDGQAGGHLHRAHGAARLRARVQPSRTRPRPLPARSERTHPDQGRAGTAAAGERAHPRHRRAADGDQIGPGEGLRRHQLHRWTRVIAADVYADFLADEYLDSYIADGGAAVKFVVAADPAQADHFSDTVRGRAAASGYATVRVDAVDVRVHMMDQVFFDVARQSRLGHAGRPSGPCRVRRRRFPGARRGGRHLGRSGGRPPPGRSG